MANININPALSALFAQVSFLNNEKVKEHLLRAQEHFESAEEFGDREWYHSLALSEINSARFWVSQSLWEQKSQAIKKERKLAKNAHKRAMKALCNSITFGKAVDYSSSSFVWEESWFDQAPSKQELDLEDNYLSSGSIFKDRTKAHQSKSKSKWIRSGKAARVLSNR